MPQKNISWETSHPGNIFMGLDIQFTKFVFINELLSVLVDIFDNMIHILLAMKNDDF